MSLELRSVNRLLVDENGDPARYWIPAYQRGYRWNQQQVKQLLDDIWDFIQDSDGKPKSAFYCLQPLVVRELNDGRIEVVDGQQRLTTIYVLLVLDRPKAIVEMLDKQPFSITYKTRDRDGSFLKNIDLGRAEENIDFYHICEARVAIEAWLGNRRDGNDVLKLMQHLLNNDEAGRNVKVIWYELSSGDDSVEVFTRLNVGKIPLTQAELVRALFLRRAALDDEGNESNTLSLQIAYEWDQIEKRLQDDDFWCFLQHPDVRESSRISLIFKLATLKAGKSLNEGDYSIFLHYAELLAPSSSAKCKWQEVKQVFMTLEEWYEDRFLFHVLGFIFHRNKGNFDAINELLTESLKLNKPSFSQYLREKVWSMLLRGKLADVVQGEIKEEVLEFCSNTKYKDLEKVRSSLLLFNLATLLRDPQSNIRFQFDSFKKYSWDIEHIRPVSDNRPRIDKHQRDWLKQCLEFLRTTKENERKDLADRVNTYLSQKEECISFEELDREIISMFNKSEGGKFHDDDLANLTLLDSHTNRVYKDAVFPVKRHILLKHDRSGIFVPLCTRNVFLKCYSKVVGDIMLWTNKDAQDYIDEICETLSWFFGGNDEK